MVEWSTASHCHCGGSGGLRGWCQGYSLCEQIYSTYAEKQQNRDRLKWNSCSAALEGIYLITINLEQISEVACLLFYCMEQLGWTAKWTKFILKQCESSPFVDCLARSAHRLSVRQLSVILCLSSKVIHRLRRAKSEGLHVLPTGVLSKAVAGQHHPEKRHSVHPGGERRRHWELHLWNPVWGICGAEDNWTGRDW